MDGIGKIEKEVAALVAVHGFETVIDTLTPLINRFGWDAYQRVYNFARKANSKLGKGKSK